MLKYESIIRETQRAQEYFENKISYTLGPMELKSVMDNENIKIIDLRHPSYYEKSHIPGAISLPGDELEMKINSLSMEDIHIVYCYNQQCHLAAKCALTFAQAELPVMELEGGFDAWMNVFEFDVEA